MTLFGFLVSKMITLLFSPTTKYNFLLQEIKNIVKKTYKNTKNEFNSVKGLICFVKNSIFKSLACFVMNSIFKSSIFRDKQHLIILK